MEYRRGPQPHRQPGLLRAELIKPAGPWRATGQVEVAHASTPTGSARSVLCGILGFPALVLDLADIFLSLALGRLGFALGLLTQTHDRLLCAGAVILPVRTTSQGAPWGTAIRRLPCSTPDVAQTLRRAVRGRTAQAAAVGLSSLKERGRVKPPSACRRLTPEAGDKRVAMIKARPPQPASEPLTCTNLCSPNGI